MAGSCCLFGSNFWFDLHRVVVASFDVCVMVVCIIIKNFLLDKTTMEHEQHHDWAGGGFSLNFKLISRLSSSALLCLIWCILCKTHQFRFLYLMISIVGKCLVMLLSNYQSSTLCIISANIADPVNARVISWKWRALLFFLGYRLASHLSHDIRIQNK